MNVLSLLASGATVLASVPAVLGHGYIIDPEAQWTLGYPSNGWGSSVPDDTLGPMDFEAYGYGPEGTLKFLEAVFPDSGYDSLGQFITANQDMYSAEVDSECGYTIYDDAKRSALPAELAYTSFTHPGPCEVWCDDNRLLFDYDCQTAYPEGRMPYDESLCAGANRFTIYWMAVHSGPWQVYTDCVWLEGGSDIGSAPASVLAVSSGTSSNTTNTATATATTEASAATSAAGSTAGEASADQGSTTDAPAPTTATPVATQKCSARRN